MMYNSIFNDHNFFGIGFFTLFGLGVLITVILVGVAIIKGYALWTAARRNEPWWFIILMVVNTIGILELIYLYFVAGKFKSKEVVNNNHSEHIAQKNHESNNG